MISNVRAVFLALIAVFGLATPVSAAPNDIVVIITNQDYAGTVPKVEYAERDGEAIAKAARDVMQVPPDRIVHVKNLTYAGFLDWFGADGEGGAELERLKAKLGRDSNIVFYYSGHGMPAKRSKASDPEPVLLPVDTSPARADRFGMPTSVVRKALLTMQREKASDGRVILILDACFSGSSGGGRRDECCANFPVRRQGRRAAPRRTCGIRPRTGGQLGPRAPAWHIHRWRS
ncbi:MAG TPA: caspase family protein [Hyphomicrobiaceae bacterium]|nr:caspase family protein [Hyphomicrobiaceae bacterium]